MIGLAGIIPSAAAGTTATVRVAANTAVVAFPPAGIGLNTAVWDGNLLDAAVPGLLGNVGITALRYPGGSTSDVYDWQTNSIVPGQGSFANPSNGFDAFMSLATKVGATPVITVNYGSGPDGTGGGSPQLAAAWVTYANVTKKYGVKYWEIGNEIYGNGFYGAQWETDLHTGHDPATYGSNVALFAAAMKAADPSIKVGVVLAAPGNWPDGQTPDWNSTVLSKCGSAIDFVIVHWYPQNPGNETDGGLLGAPQSGIDGSPGIAVMMAKLKSLIAQFGGANASTIQILVTETNSVSSNPGKQTTSVVNAMFVADGMMTWLENGAASVDVWDLHNGSTNGNASSNLFGPTTFGDYGILSNGSGGEPAADAPFPTYFGMEMVHRMGQAGDALVAATSSNPLLSAHAVRQANGDLALMLINKDPTNATTATVHLTGYTPKTSATVYSYGQGSTAVTSATVTGLRSTFSVPAAPYSITSVVLSPAVIKPSFSLSANPASVVVMPGGSGTAAITISRFNGFTGNVGFAVRGLPAGVAASFSSASGTAGTVLTLSASAGAELGGSVLTITGTSGALSASTTLSLTVAKKPSPSFSLSASPSAVNLVQKGSGSATITVEPLAGFNDAVALTATGLPAGVTARFSPATTTSASTLTLSASSTATLGNATVTVNGTSGSLTQTVTVPISVTEQGVGAGPATFTGFSETNGPWFTEDDVGVTAAAPITNLALTITVPSANVHYSGMYNNIGGQVVNSHVIGTNIVYTFSVAGAQSIPAGKWVFAAQMGGNGTAHLLSGDTWKVTYTVGGVTYTQSGAF